MIWIFLAVVLVLLVLHRGFRRVVFWLAGAVVVGSIVLLIAMAIHDRYREQAARKAEIPPWETPAPPAYTFDDGKPENFPTPPPCPAVPREGDWTVCTPTPKGDSK